VFKPLYIKYRCPQATDLRFMKIGMVNTRNCKISFCHFVIFTPSEKPFFCRKTLRSPQKRREKVVQKNAFAFF
jgi:hypothetical protein